MNVTLDESYAYCRSLAKRTARNFYYSFLGLPPDRLRAMCVLYAFMRLTDDLGDDDSKPSEQRAVELVHWKEQFELAMSGGECRHEVFPALVDVISRFGIPHEYFLAVIEGVRMDVEPEDFQTFDDLRKYCYHVAGAVGLCCIHIWGFHDPRAVESAVECGLAFQLTNILRDLRVDAEMGRVYIPAEDLQRFEYSAADIAAACTDGRFHRLMEFETARAKDYYRKAEELFDYLEPVGKPILRAMLRIYGGLLAEIERRDYDVFSHQVSLPGWKKLLIAADALLRRQWPGRT